MLVMADWSFLTKHAQALACIAHDPEVRLRDIATKLGITERTAYGIVTDLADAGYVVKGKDGRRNRYMIQAHLRLRTAVTGEQTIGEVLDLLVDTDARRQAGGGAGEGGWDGPPHRFAVPTWEEPFGIAMVEPWRFETPVVAHAEAVREEEAPVLRPMGPGPGAKQSSA